LETYLQLKQRFLKLLQDNSSITNRQFVKILIAITRNEFTNAQVLCHSEKNNFSIIEQRINKSINDFNLKELINLLNIYGFIGNLNSKTPFALL